MVEPGQGVRPASWWAAPLKEGVPVHCGVSGTVSAVENRRRWKGKACAWWWKTTLPGRRRSGLKREEGREGLIRLMQEAGLVGMGGAGFPTYRKYAWDKPLEQVLINGCECEPYLTCDHALMLYWPERVVAGAKAMGEAAAAPRWSSVWRTTSGTPSPGWRRRRATAGCGCRSCLPVIPRAESGS